MSSKANTDCDWCGDRFYKKPNEKRDSNNHFCSRECYGNFMSENRSGKNSPLYKKQEVECENCNKLMQRKPCHIKEYKNLFCSNSCKNEYKEKTNEYSKENSPCFEQEKVNCTNCGNDFYLKPYRIEIQENYFCKKDCRIEWRSNNWIGKNHPSWEGGTEKIGFGPHWHKIREKIIKRDNETCQVCGMSRKRHKKQYDRDLEVDHIKPRKEFVENGKLNYEEANKPSNLNTLCQFCHADVEYTRKELKNAC